MTEEEEDDLGEDGELTALLCYKQPAKYSKHLT